MKKYALCSIALILVMLVSFSLFSCTDNDTQIQADEKLSSWMSHINDDTPIRKIALPGSHDSGTKGMMFAAETQKATIYEQLLLGVRYFDIRVSGDKDGGKIFHGPIKGAKFTPIAKSILDFIKNNKSEFLILDFQHFEKGGEKNVFDTLTSIGLFDYAVKKENEDMDDFAFINSLTLKDVRGKVLVLFGNNLADKYDYIFKRNNDSCSLDDERVLDSLYMGNEHKKGSDHFVKTALPKYFKHIIDKNTGLQVLQGQLTAPNFVTSLYKLENTHSDNMNKFTREIKDNENYLNAVNIIIRDFVEADKEKVLSIIGLNYYKKNVKDSFNTELYDLCFPNVEK